MDKHNGIVNVIEMSSRKLLATSVLVASVMLPMSSHASGLVDADQARMEGRFADAQLILEQVVSTSVDTKSGVQGLGLLAYMNLVNLEFDEAERLLNQADQKANVNNWSDVKAELANYRGIYFQKLGQYSEALEQYQASKALAANAAQQNSEHQAMLNIALLHDQYGFVEQAKSQLAILTEALSNNSSAFAPHWLGAAKLALSYGQKQALDLLNMGKSLAENQQDTYSISIAYGYLGNLFEVAGKYDEALNFTDVAMKHALAGDFGNLLVQWEWQRGRIFKAQGDTQRSLNALRRAVVHVEASRQDIPVEYSGGRSSFRETLGPLYTDLSRALLDVASNQSGAAQQSLYREARQSIELIKRTELEDYFNNRCALTGVDEVVLDDIGDRTASLYPIIFEDRLDLLVSIKGVISHFTTTVSSTNISAYAETLASNLRDQEDFKLQAQKLYQWLIDPVKPELERANVDTIVFLPDGVLRLVPMSILNNGSRFLVQDYAVVTSPGLSVFDPKPTNTQQYSALLAGLSYPGDVVKDLPNEVLSGLLPDSSNMAGLKQRAVSESTPIARDLPDDTLGMVKANLEIPGVAEEVSQLSKVLPSKTLLNESFTKANLVDSMLQSPYKVVHIASHGVFGSNADNSFIMAHDQIISMNELESLLYSEKFKDDPIELITLSACQTAEGDDRAPLGLSGVALQAKVRSAMGSLWSISDEATVKFMASFYSNLMSGKMTKSEALRQAQISFIQDDEFAHPYYWSPFILIGNWL